MSAIAADLRVRDLRQRRVAVYGLGKEGIAALRLIRTHASPSELVVVIDVAPDTATALLPADLADVPVFAGDHANAALRNAEVIVKSPGVSPYHGRLFEHGRHAAITGGTALWFAETNGDRTIAVTGSKGKSTTTSLVAHLLRALGRSVTLAGNVGVALLDVLDAELRSTKSVDRSNDAHDASDTTDADHVYALELSSFQSAEVRHSPQVGVLTALFPEHLDWHENELRYYADKCNLFAHRDGIRVATNLENPHVLACVAQGVVPGAIAYAVDRTIRVDANSVGDGGRVLDTDGSLLADLTDARLPGRHNAVNLCGAFTALRAFDIDIREHRDELAHAARTFEPLAHRLQPVGEHRGRLVIDDSLSTAPQAAVAALAAFANRPIGIVIGGHDRGLDYQPLADAFAARTSPTWVAGVPQSGERILELIDAALTRANNRNVRTASFDDFDAAVRNIAEQVPTGGVLLLSPAAPSFGRFRDYAERGHHFRSLLGIANESGTVR